MFRVKKDRIEYENKSLRLPTDLIEKVQELADKNEISFNKVVIQCIDYALDQNLCAVLDNAEVFVIQYGLFNHISLYPLAIINCLY